jgi:hypothetical protein
MPEALQPRIMQSGSGWYWEVLSPDHEVIASGLADTHAQARAATEKVSLPSSRDDVHARTHSSAAVQ